MMATAVSVGLVEKEHPWMIQTGKLTKESRIALPNNEGRSNATKLRKVSI